MEYIYLGHTGVRVSEVCLGTMTFGKEADETESIAMMNRAVEAGVNFFDGIVAEWQGTVFDLREPSAKAAEGEASRFPTTNPRRGCSTTCLRPPPDRHRSNRADGFRRSAP